MMRNKILIGFLIFFALASFRAYANDCGYVCPSGTGFAPSGSPAFTSQSIENDSVIDERIAVILAGRSDICYGELTGYRHYYAEVASYPADGLSYVKIYSTVTSCQSFPQCVPPEINNPDNPFECISPSCDFPKEWIEVNGVFECKLPPVVCEDDEVTYDNVTCVRCPINETPNATQTECVCLPPMAYYTHLGKTKCINPNIDSDGDGVPDEMDAFPRNQNETHDNDGDGIGDNADSDDDNDGYSDAQEAREGTNPNDSEDNGGTNGSGTSADGGGDNNGEDTFGGDCRKGFEPAPDWETSGKCIEIKKDDNCDHVNNRHGHPFQSITSAISCNSLIHSSPSGKGWKDILPNCSQGAYACFYTTAEDEENNSDDNNTISDSNTTDNFDDSGIITKLDEIKKTNSGISSKISSLNDSINTQTSTLSDKFDQLITTNYQGTSDLKSSLGSKLDSIKSAINNKPVGGTNMTETNMNLNDMKNSLDDYIASENAKDDEEDAEKEESKDEMEASLSDAEGLLDDALASFAQNKNDLIALANGFSSPTISSSGDCTLSANPPRLGSFSVDFNFLSQLRPFFQFFLNLFLLYITIKFYVVIARDIALHISNI